MQLIFIELLNSFDLTCEIQLIIIELLNDSDLACGITYIQHVHMCSTLILYRVFEIVYKQLNLFIINFKNQKVFSNLILNLFIIIFFIKIIRNLEFLIIC